MPIRLNILVSEENKNADENADKRKGRQNYENRDRE
jgi:hypothetical protein